jgi:hypothetical protein
MSDEERIDLSCERCGAPGKEAGRWPRLVFYCDPCRDEYRERLTRLVGDLRKQLPRLTATGLGRRCVWPLARAYAWEGMSGLMAASDASLVRVGVLGPKMLAAFRAACPRPLDDSGWHEHAAMVALAS